MIYTAELLKCNMENMDSSLFNSNPNIVSSL